MIWAIVPVSHKQAIWQFLLLKRMLQCLKQSVSTAQTSLIPQKFSPWIVQRWSVPFVPPQDIPPLMQSTPHNPWPTNHICIKSKMFPLLPALRGISEEKGFNLPSPCVWKVRKTHIYCSYCATLDPIPKPNPFLTTCLLQNWVDFQKPRRESFIQL